LVHLLVWVEEKVKVFIFNRYFWTSCICEYDDVFCWWSYAVFVGGLRLFIFGESDCNFYIFKFYFFCAKMYDLFYW